MGSPCSGCVEALWKRKLSENPEVCGGLCEEESYGRPIRSPGLCGDLCRKSMGHPGTSQQDPLEGLHTKELTGDAKTSYGILWTASFFI